LQKCSSVDVNASCEYILVRYGEIGLKGKNRPKFEKRLVGNIRCAVGDLGRINVSKIRGRLMVKVDEVDTSEVIERLGRVFGLVSFSPVLRVDATPEAVFEASLTSMQQGMEREGYSTEESSEPVTFRVTVNRADKTFPIQSMELARQLGGHLLAGIPGLKVKLHQPDLIVSVDIREGQAFVFSQTIPGLGGLPVGVSGKAMLLLSGGIDSPVAGWMSMKRGIELEAIHFHSFPFTGEKSKEKVADLCRVLTRYGGNINLHVAHFTDIQKEIQKKCPEEFRVTIMRRFMYRMAQRLAEHTGALALITGESVGQVASQTLESMVAINEVTLMPVLRPVVGFDKYQIVKIAEQIGTYDISIQPYEDCCTLFLPKHPSTKPNLEKVHTAEESLDIEGLIEAALEKTETLSFYRNEA